MDLEGIMLSEISQRKKDKYCMIITYTWNLNKQKKTQKQTHRKTDQTCGYQRRGVGKGNWRKVVKRYKLPLVKQISTSDVTRNMMTIANTAV